MREGGPGTECRSGVGADGGWLCCCSLIALQMSIRKGVGRRGGIQRLKVRCSKEEKKVCWEICVRMFYPLFGLAISGVFKGGREDRKRELGWIEG